jgi:hypothetical protein
MMIHMPLGGVPRIMYLKLLLLAVFAFTPAFADILSFPEFTCAAASTGIGPNIDCNNFSYINQSYGDTANVDVTYRDLIRTGEALRWWNVGYNDLVGVAWGGTSDAPGASWSRIELRPLNGSVLTLNGFSLGAYSFTTRNSNVRVLELDTNNVLTDYGTLAIGFGATTHTDFLPADASSNGIAIEWRDSAYNVGIDNINFSVGPASGVIPEPSTFVLLAGGLAAMVVRRKRRS